MHSMTAVLAADTTAPPDPATQGDEGGWVADALTAVFRWLVDVVPGGFLTLIGVGIAIHLMVGGKKATTRTDRGVIGFFKAAIQGVCSLAKTLWSIVRFFGGYELYGEPRSTATFFTRGTPTDRPAKAPAAAMGSVAALDPRVSLVKPRRRQPSPWARNLGRWLTAYRGRGARALDCAVTTALWAARAAGKVWRGLKAVWAALAAVYGVVAPIVTTIARALATWHCWPYAARGLARIALIAAAVGLAVPAWRTRTILALLLALVAVVLLARKHRPAPPSDDQVYGPRLWVILREDLNLPDDEPREAWLHLPASIADPAARIVLRLPAYFRGSEVERTQITDLINSRLPGEWVPRFSFTGEQPKVVYTHKPPPKPKAPEPECPEGVDFFADDIQEAIASCEVGQVVLGKDENQNIIIRRLDGETPHWALSVGTGGGKSTFNMNIAVQLIAQGYHIIVIDPKRSSVKPLEGIPGVHIYGDPKNAQDMRAAIGWFKDEIDARSYVKDKDEEREFPGLLLLIEEANEFADISKEWWDDNRKTKDDEDGPKDRAADTVWGDVASAARLGRFVRGNILAVFQDLRDQALGGKGLRNLFRLKFMGNYTVNQWKNVIGTTPVPDSVDKAGRMMIVEGNSNRWVQTLYAPGKELRDWAMKRRKEQDFDPAAGLFGTAPERSPERMPHLVRVASRDNSPTGPNGAPEGGLSDETAGRGVTHPQGVTDDVTASRDRLRLIPGQAYHGAPEGPDAPLEPAPEAPVLLSLAAAARELQDRGFAVEANTMRQHKKRRESTGFPVGVQIDGSEKFTLAQLIYFYEKRGYERTEEPKKDDAV